MIEQQPSTSGSVLEAEQVLIAVPDVQDGQDITRYFTSEAAANAAYPRRIQEIMSLAGAWSDLDWDTTQEALDRIRHESVQYLDKYIPESRAR